MNSISQQKTIGHDKEHNHNGCHNIKDSQYQQQKESFHQLQPQREDALGPLYQRLDTCSSIQLTNITDMDSLKLEKNKLHAIKELLQTERDYVKDLSYLVEVCLSALDRQQWIPASHRSLIARNSREIFEFHKHFIVYYDTISTYDNDWSFIAQAFLDQMDHFLLYKTFCDLHSDAWALTCKYRDRPEWMQFLQDCIKVMTYSIPFSLLAIDSSSHGEYNHKKLLFEDYLIKPVQRICRYQLLVKEIIRYTDYQTPEYKLWSTVLCNLQHIVTDIDISNCHRDIQERTQRFFNRVTSDWRINKHHLIQLGDFLIAGAIEVTYSAIGHSVSKTRYLGCFVFTTYLVMVEPRKLTVYEPKYWFPLRMADLDDTEGEIQHSFIVTCKKHIFAFRASCSLEKRLWVKKIKEAILTSKAIKETPLELIIPSLSSGLNPLDNKLISRRSMIHFKEPTETLNMKRKLTIKESTKKRRSMDCSLLAKAEPSSYNTETESNTKPLRRPKSMVLLSTPTTTSNIIRRMSMQFKNYQQIYDDIDYKLHDVCTLDYLSSRTWHRQLYSFTATSKKADLKKRKSIIHSRFSIRSTEWADHRESDLDSTNPSSFSSHSVLRGDPDLHGNNIIDTPGSESTCVETEKTLIKRPSRRKIFTEKVKRKIGSLHKKNTRQNNDLLLEKKPVVHEKEKLDTAKGKWKSKFSVLLPSSFLKN